ncbi:MAG: bifunctional fucokinase/L-fucose-1-P-guanylyltransferase [Prevotella sp.]|nr:bifunctional fucokinase/L-fucose-1-P-guanylyltransferase [Prevotella sp.]
MRKLLSLPPNLVECFNEITGYDKTEYFCSNDPVGRKLGSGGGTAWLLRQCYEADATGDSFDEWLATDRRLLLHAGGQSRRLPAYAPAGKVLTPIPVFRWERGQRLSQHLLSLQVPLYEKIMDAAPQSLRTMIVSGDVLIRATEDIGSIPEADVVCYGLWLGPEIAKDHGVFVSSRSNPTKMKCMLQKPDVSTLAELLKDHFYLTDIGIWLFSDKAIKVLMKRSTDPDGNITNYDMYTTFGGALGYEPTISDEEINGLSVAVLPLPGGEFYHFGTSHELIESSLEIQNIVRDQREIIHKSRKPHPSMFVQNADTQVAICADNHHLWIENSTIGRYWKLAHHNIITGVPRNDWKIELRPGQCVDVVPIGEKEFVIRPYGYNDLFRGDLTDPSTIYLGEPFHEWLDKRGVTVSDIEGADDMQTARLFPVVEDELDIQLAIRWMLNEPSLQGGRLLWTTYPRISADEISARANFKRIEEQRCEMRAGNWPFLARNYQHSVFYQVDLYDAANEFYKYNIAMPHPLPDSEPLMTRMHDAMFRGELARRRGMDYADYEKRAFDLLREGLTHDVAQHRQLPKKAVYDDQIVWGRSPVRIDLAGGWTDTPPYCLMEGGNVINIAIRLNGQQPLQTYVKPCKRNVIMLRSIDLGAVEEVTTFEQLADFNHVGSPFSIPKAALVLAGFHPDFCMERYDSLQRQLEDFGCGIEVTLLSAIPAGSGLGTSSMLAATVLGALSDFCSLAWDRSEIGMRTLVLEQLLTSGGGWQDQFGGILPGVKLLQTQRGLEQSPVVRWLPEALFTQPEYRDCHLLYYTGITRTAKKILSEIVRRMFLNHNEELAILKDMKCHTMDMYETIQRQDFESFGRLIRKTWKQNQQIDAGTNPPDIQHLSNLIDDYCLGYKLPGAGGGGYMYMVAKDQEAAARIRATLNANSLNANARFVDLSLSQSGLQVSRS